jgi:hypothetical protein
MSMELADMEEEGSSNQIAQKPVYKREEWKEEESIESSILS